MLYGSGIPVMYIIAAIYFFFTYWFDKLLVFYNHKKLYDDLEHGMHITRIIEKAGDEVEKLGSLRALINEKYKRTKRYFFTF